MLTYSVYKVYIQVHMYYMQSILSAFDSTDAPFCSHHVMFSGSVFVMYAYMCEQILIQDIIYTVFICTCKYTRT